MLYCVCVAQYSSVVLRVARQHVEVMILDFLHCRHGDEGGEKMTAGGGKEDVGTGRQEEERWMDGAIKEGSNGDCLSTVVVAWTGQGAAQDDDGGSRDGAAAQGRERKDGAKFSLTCRAEERKKNKWAWRGFTVT